VKRKEKKERGKKREIVSNDEKRNHYQGLNVSRTALTLLLERREKEGKKGKEVPTSP